MFEVIVSKCLFKFGIIVSVMILIFCVLGLVCDVVVVNLMGVGVSVDVFFFVNWIFNFLCWLFVEGVFF